MQSSGIVIASQPSAFQRLDMVSSGRQTGKTSCVRETKSDNSFQLPEGPRPSGTHRPIFQYRTYRTRKVFQNHPFIIEVAKAVHTEIKIPNLISQSAIFESISDVSTAKEKKDFDT